MVYDNGKVSPETARLSEQMAGMRPMFEQQIQGALNAAYRKGAEDMRERCAKVTERIGDRQKFGYTLGVCRAIAAEITSLPLTEQPDNGQERENQSSPETP